MNVYFACSITGGRQDEEVYRVIVDALLKDGHDVPTAHLALSEVIYLEKIVDPVEVYSRDIKWIFNCDALIADVSTPSHGVGYEVAYALSLGKPVLCCHAEGLEISKMISGNTNERLKVAAYESPEDAVLNIREFLIKIKQLDSKNL